MTEQYEYQHKRWCTIPTAPILLCLMVVVTASSTSYAASALTTSDYKLGKTYNKLNTDNIPKIGTRRYLQGGKDDGKDDNKPNGGGGGGGGKDDDKNDGKDDDKEDDKDDNKNQQKVSIFICNALKLLQ